MCLLALYPRAARKSPLYKVECPAGKRDGVVFMDIGGRLLVNRREVGVGGTMIIVSVIE